MTSRSPAATSTASEAASSYLREALASGALRPDDPVREEEWATRLGISRTPVREAIQDLVARGIFQRRGRTAHVFRPSLPELLEIYDIRLPLERLAAVRCAELATKPLCDELAARFDKIKKRRADSGWYTDHEAFHMQIFRGSDMPRLVNMIENLRSQSEPYVRFAVHVDQRFRDESRVQHSGILDAIRAHDQEATAAIVETHLATTRRKITELMEVYGIDMQPAMRTFGR
jgi:DNA-binding GntR family transcriptional regulator